MKFTICIPTYNRGYIIKRTIESVVRQSYKNFEIIIIDDGSTDNTREIVHSIQNKYDVEMYYLFQENQGKHIALNNGIKNAKGDFFIILDSDDMLIENALELMKNEWESIPMSQHPLYCGVIGKCINTNGNDIGKKFAVENISYIDFHFVLGPFGDCCECIRLDVLRAFEFPQIENVKFVPEAYVFDQIGIKYKLKTTNEILKIVEYLDDGITLNNNHFIRKNALGYIYYYSLIIEKILPIYKKNIPYKRKIIIFLKYWRTIKHCDNKNSIPKIKIPFYWKFLKGFTFILERGK